MVSLGQKIRQQRLNKGLTQTHLASGLVSPSAISQIESDKITPSYKLLCQIAERLEVPLEVFIAEKDDYLEQSTSHKLAKTFLMAKEYVNALPILNKLLSSQGPGEDTDLLMDLGTCLLELKDYSKAQDLFEKVMYAALKAGDDVLHVTVLHRLGRLFYAQHNISLSLHYWQKAHDQMGGLDGIDRFQKAEITTNLAIVHNHLGHYDRSSELFRQSMELLKDTTNLFHLATNYLGLGQSFYGKQEYKLAEEYCEEAITIFKNLDHIRHSIEAKVNFGILRGEQGDYEGALNDLMDCLKELYEHGFDRHTSNAHSEVAKYLTRLSRYDEAASHLEKAFSNCEPGTAIYGECYFVRSQWSAALERYDEAISDAKQAAAIFQQVEALQEYNKSCLHLSDIYKRLDDYKSSTEVLEESQHYIQSYLKERGFRL
jgi:HTH-type transcriptional regulator, quorum sensing regulator NprR